jgi:thymidylate kinase
MVDRAYVVELTGARGAGKTTFASQLRRELLVRKLTASFTGPPREGLLFRLRSIVDHLEALVVFGRWQPESRRELMALARRYRCLKQRFRRARGLPGVHVVDEGTWHLILTAYVKTRRKDMGLIMATLRRRLPLPDMVVLLDCAEDAISVRRSARANAGDRKHPRLNASGREGLLALRAAMADLVGPAQRPSCLIIDNGDHHDPATVAAEVAHLVELATARASPNRGPSLRPKGPLRRPAPP